MQDNESLAWTRKYRPRSFAEYMGDDVKNLVKNRFKDSDNIPQTIMLYGTRGTGKTSMARLLCKEIHCLNKIDGHACGECEMCEMIDNYISSTEAGESCDGIVEIDAATTTGKNDINEIIDSLLSPPMWPLKRIVAILDECHKLSNSAQNSLLKVIEEPPPHLVFILCTTDPDDVIATIHSRMQLKIEVRKKSVEELADRLMEIGELEKLTISREACQLIAKKKDRIPRDSISLLETVAKNFGKVNIENVLATVKDIGSDIYFDFFRACNTSLEDILVFNTNIKEKDIDISKFISGLARFVLDCMYIKYGISMDDFDKEFAKSAKEVFDIYSSNDLDAMLHVIETAALEMGLDDNKNELVLTTTAMRLGKIKILASGLGLEASLANSENRKSLNEYQKQLKEDQAALGSNTLTYEPTKQAFAEMFKGVTIIESPKQNENITKPEEVDLGSGGTHFSNEQLESLMSDM